MSTNDELSNTDLYNKILAAIKLQSDTVKGEIKAELAKVSDVISGKIEDQKRKISELETKCNQLKQYSLSVDRRLRKNNIVIFGLDVNENAGLLNVLINFFRERLGVVVEEADLNNFYTVKTDKGIHVKVEFISYLKKLSVLRNAPKLKGSRIFIEHDLCFEDRKDSKTLRDHLKVARSENLPAKIRNNKLMVGNETYTAEQLINLSLVSNSGKTTTSRDLVITALHDNSASPSAPPPSPLVSNLNSKSDQLIDVSRLGVFSHLLSQRNCQLGVSNFNTDMERSVAAQSDSREIRHVPTTSSSQIVTRHRGKK